MGKREELQNKSYIPRHTTTVYSCIFLHASFLKSSVKMPDQ